MNTASEQTQRPKWQIDLVLERLLSQQVRVAGESFRPPRWDGEPMERWIPVSTLVLPTNQTPEGLRVFFEGRLESFVRHVGVVEVTLAAPSAPQMSEDGIVAFRGTSAVILHGPATVRLAFPFVVEQIPSEAVNYWRDLQAPRAQFELPL